MKPKMTIENMLDLTVYNTDEEIDTALLNYGHFINFIATLMPGNLGFRDTWYMAEEWFTYHKEVGKHFAFGFGSSNLWVKQIDPATKKVMSDRIILVEF